MIKANKNGKYSTEDVKSTGLPIFDFTVTENPGITIDFWTATSLKEIGLKLSEEEKTYQNIKGFVKVNNYGWSALYSLTEVLARRDIHIKITTSN